MPTTEDMTTNEMIAVGTVPIHPGVLDYSDAKGKVVLFVRDQEEGRSIFLGVELYGMVDRLYEVRYDDWEAVVTRMIGQVGSYSLNDPFNELLGGSE